MLLFVISAERVLEDHENVVENTSHWPRDHNNHLLFKNNPEKYHIIKRPQLLMPPKHVYSSTNSNRNRGSFTEEQKKNIILKEIFEHNIMPPVEGDLYIREGKKSNWKKHYFVLRASGLYYSKNARSTVRCKLC
jgi:amyloid beta A4 precursor protein-binding family B protein 1-interacting protein